MQSFDDQVRSWAASKPADEEYDYDQPSSCALCQFLEETGCAKEPRVIPYEWRDGLWSKERHSFSDRLEKALDCRPWTFGALAERLSR